MTRYAILMSLSACATAQVDPPPVTGEATCDAAGVQQLIGQVYSEAVGERALRLSRSGTLRVTRPGQPVTMDYRTDRLNIEVDGGGVILTFSCG